MESNSANPALSTLKILSGKKVVTTTRFLLFIYLHIYYFHFVGGHRTTRVTDNLRSDALKLCASSDKSVTAACGPKFAKLHWQSQVGLAYKLPIRSRTFILRQHFYCDVRMCLCTFRNDHSPVNSSRSTCHLNASTMLPVSGVSSATSERWTGKALNLYQIPRPSSPNWI